MFNYNYFQRNNATVSAIIKGSSYAPNLFGVINFYHVVNGTMVCVTVNGLPTYQPATSTQQQIGPFGFHLHEYGSCEIEKPDNPYESAGGHWNPYNQPHGNHAGDFPVLFSNNGYAHMCFFTDKFKPEDIIGKSVVIHQSPDDYKSQPSGDSGKRIACGVITSTY